MAEDGQGWQGREADRWLGGSVGLPCARRQICGWPHRPELSLSLGPSLPSGTEPLGPDSGPLASPAPMPAPSPECRDDRV